MNNDILLALITGRPVDQRTLVSALYEMCDRVHASCDDDCLVYKLNGSKVPDTAHSFEVNRGCDCFKNGQKMMAFIKQKA